MPAAGLPLLHWGLVCLGLGRLSPIKPCCEPSIPSQRLCCAHQAQVAGSQEFQGVEALPVTGTSADTSRGGEVPAMALPVGAPAPGHGHGEEVEEQEHRMGASRGAVGPGPLWVRAAATRPHPGPVQPHEHPSPSLPALLPWQSTVPRSRGGLRCPFPKSLSQFPRPEPPDPTELPTLPGLSFLPAATCPSLNKPPPVGSCPAPGPPRSCLVSQRGAQRQRQPQP